MVKLGSHLFYFAFSFFRNFRCRGSNMGGVGVIIWGCRGSNMGVMLDIFIDKNLKNPWSVFF